MRNRNQGEEDKQKVTWSTACRSRKGYRVGAWSEGRKENWFPEKRRVPSADVTCSSDKCHRAEL